MDRSARNLIAGLLLLAPLGASAAGAAGAVPDGADPFEAALAQARERRVPVLVDYTAPWCYSCYYMARNVLTGAEWRWVEHAGWVVFEDIFLIRSCVQGVEEMKGIGDRQAQLDKMLGGGQACLALFAAADALKIGFVSGVPTYVYVQRIRPSILAGWKILRPSTPGEPPDVILRQAPAAQSVFRGAVRPGGIAACDVLQVWVDLASHPSRGREQADLIRKRVLQRVIEGGDPEK